MFFMPRIDRPVKMLALVHCYLQSPEKNESKESRALSLGQLSSRGATSIITTLIVLAHPEPASFNASWARTTEMTSRTLGHDVLWSDLCAMKFDPVEKPEHYPQNMGNPFDVLKAQEAASACNSLPADVAGEISKIRAADRIIFHFPIWWFSIPAILKGWCERVLANGAMHDVDNRFDRGLFCGKKVLFCVTTGSRSTESAYSGKEGDVQMLLWPFAYTLRYLGFSVLKPKICHGIHGYHKGAAKVALEDRLTSELASHGKTIEAFDNLPQIAFNADTEFDQLGQLRPDCETFSAFIRHIP
jgi:NAD(P)H dehydrogenase (quinone)